MSSGNKIMRKVAWLKTIRKRTALRSATMTFAIFIVLILLVLGVIAAAIALAPKAKPSIRDNARRTLSEPRRTLSESRHPLAVEPSPSFEYFVPTTPSEPSVSVGQMNLAVSDNEFAPWVLTSDFEDGETNSEGIDWLTGQSRDVCECEDCGNWRKQRVGN
jgi:hypothetical protein